ncbi:MAG: serine hydrolase, partial [Opitutales bacterium]|nr:serine hydrolase [Opitutales bacterium]
MKNILPFGLLTCLMALQGKEIPRAKPEDAGMSGDKLKQAAKVVQGYIDDKKIAGAITVVARKGKIVQFQTYGHMDIERKKTMQEDAIFRIFSMSKAIVTAGALILHEEGKFNPSDPVSQYLPKFKNLKVLGKNG